MLRAVQAAAQAHAGGRATAPGRRQAIREPCYSRKGLTLCDLGCFLFHPCFRVMFLVVMHAKASTTGASRRSRTPGPSKLFLREGPGGEQLLPGRPPLPCRACIPGSSHLLCRRHRCACRCGGIYRICKRRSREIRGQKPNLGWVQGGPSSQVTCGLCSRLGCSWSRRKDDGKEKRGRPALLVWRAGHLVIERRRIVSCVDAKNKPNWAGRDRPLNLSSWHGHDRRGEDRVSPSGTTSFP
jgi:hypothetical protein